MSVVARYCLDSRCYGRLLSPRKQQRLQTSRLLRRRFMAGVAANQDRAEAYGSHYVYLQHACVYSRKGPTVMRRDHRISRHAYGRRLPPRSAQSQRTILAEAQIRDLHDATRQEERNLKPDGGRGKRQECLTCRCIPQRGRTSSGSDWRSRTSSRPPSDTRRHPPGDLD
jgi:hypothetical protein